MLAKNECCYYDKTQMRTCLLQRINKAECLSSNEKDFLKRFKET